MEIANVFTAGFVEIKYKYICMNGNKFEVKKSSLKNRNNYQNVKVCAESGLHCLSGGFLLI